MLVCSLVLRHAVSMYVSLLVGRSRRLVTQLLRSSSQSVSRAVSTFGGQLSPMSGG